jgi:hypothetical protein
MKSVGLIAASTAATILCIAIVLNSSMLFVIAGAQPADTPVTNASVTGTIGNDGWYTTNASVNLTATGGSSMNYTMYKLDNGPLTNYTSNITITDGNHTLQYYSANDSGGSILPIYLNVKVDTQPPVTNMTINGNRSAGGWYNGTVTVNLTASDATSGVNETYYSLNQGAVVQYSGNFTVYDGNNTLTYGSIDQAGNFINYTVPIDVFNPSFSVQYNNTAVPGTAWFTSNVTVTLAIDSNESIANQIQYSFNGNNWTNGPTFQISGEGAHEFFYRAVDSNGNPGITHDMWIGIDMSSPTIGISIAGDQDKSTGWYNGDITVYINANSNAGISQTQYSWNNNSWTNYTGPFGVSWGMSRAIYYRATDMVGNMTYGSSFIYFRPENIDLGTILGGDVFAGQNPTPTPTPTPTPITTPSPTPVPTSQPLMPTSTPTTSPPQSSDTMAVGVIMAVLALMVIAGLATYLFMLKPK